MTDAAHLCDLCRWYTWAYVNDAWQGHVCQAPDYQHEMAAKKAFDRGRERPEDACRHFAWKEMDDGI